MIAGQLLTFVRGDMIQMTMSPLPPGVLRSRIELLTASVGFPFDRIFVYEGTKRYLMLQCGLEPLVSIGALYGLIGSGGGDLS